MPSNKVKLDSTHHIRNIYTRWKRWNMHLFIVLFLNILLWIGAFAFYQQIDVLAGFFRFRALFGGFMVITILPLAAHYVHVRIANAEDEAIANALQDERSAWTHNNRHLSDRLERLENEDYEIPRYDEKEKREQHRR